MNLYHEILKDPAIAQKEETERLAKRTSEEASKLQRLQWLDNIVTREYVREIELEFIKLATEILNLSETSEVSELTIRLKLVEQQTISKVLNLIKYGKYVSNSTVK